MSSDPQDSSRLVDSPDVRIGGDTRAAVPARSDAHLLGAILAFVPRLFLQRD